MPSVQKCGAEWPQEKSVIKSAAKYDHNHFNLCPGTYNHVGVYMQNLTEIGSAVPDLSQSEEKSIIKMAAMHAKTVQSMSRYIWGHMQNLNEIGQAVADLLQSKEKSIIKMAVIHWTMTKTFSVQGQARYESLCKISLKSVKQFWSYHIHKQNQ